MFDYKTGSICSVIQMQFAITQAMLIRYFAVSHRNTPFYVPKLFIYDGTSNK